MRSRCQIRNQDLAALHIDACRKDMTWLNRKSVPEHCHRVKHVSAHHKVSKKHTCSGCVRCSFGPAHGWARCHWRKEENIGTTELWSNIIPVLVVHNPNDLHTGQTQVCYLRCTGGHEAKDPTLLVVQKLPRQSSVKQPGNSEFQTGGYIDSILTPRNREPVLVERLQINVLYVCYHPP